mmetsp:Transcript_22789/g.59298  ORF Transcript_22789/g.59298 Transcript_22789/m.59298 type:complete len:749 (-) Transcript_22789:64-2310(-)
MEAAPVEQQQEQGVVAEGPPADTAPPAAALAPPDPVPMVEASADLPGSPDSRIKKASIAAIVSGEGPVSSPLALRHERLQGTISKYVPTSGWGFVRSHLFDGEVGFKMESIMLECQNYEFKENEAVEFDVQSDERGRPHAVMLKPIVGRKPSECIGQRHCGYVRRFADRWGFLNAAAFDGDLFVHRDNLLLSPEQMQDGLPPLRTGQSVEFDVACDDRGRTVAKQITTSALLRPCEWIGRRLHGYIRSFQGAWGFINSDRFAGDLFIHSDSVLPQFQGVELTVGTMVEFDVERDHHRKGGKNRLVARQVAILHQPNTMQQQAASPYGMLPQHHYPQALPPDPMALYGGMPPGGQLPGHYGSGLSQAVPADPMAMYGGMPPGGHLPGLYGSGLNPQALPADPMAMYGGMAPGGHLPGLYGSGLNPQAASFAPPQASTMYYPGPGSTPGALPPDPSHGLGPLGPLGYQPPPYPYQDLGHYGAQPGLPPQHLLPPVGPQHGLPPHYGQIAPPGGDPSLMYSLLGQPAPSPYGQLAAPQAPQPHPGLGQPLPGQPHQPLPSQYQGYAGQPCGQPLPQPGMPGLGAIDPARQAVAPQPQVQQQPAVPEAYAGGTAPATDSEQPQVLLHITTHDWEPDQSGQLRVRKGTLVNVSHRAAHGWVYAATVQPGGEAGEPVAEGWVPQAVAKRVSLCRVVVDWPAEGSGTLGLHKGDLIAVSKEAERGWVYGERISPRRPELPVDGWLPKKVLEYILH